MNLFGADAAAVAWRMRSAVALLRDGLLVKRPYVRVVEHLPLAAAAHAAHAAHAAAAHAAHAAVAHAARAAARARAAAVALLRVRKVVAEIGGARVDDDAHQLEELGRASGLAGSPRVEPALGVWLEVELHREGARRVDLDVGHRLVVELEALELDDQRLRQLAEADALLRVDLLARIERVRVLALQTLSIDEFLQARRDVWLALDLELDRDKVLEPLRNLARSGNGRGASSAAVV